MGIFDKYNTRGTIMEGVETDQMDFAPLKDFCGQKVKCQGFFFTEGRYGRQVVVIGGGFLINMPQRAVEQFEGIANDEQALNAVLKGKLMLTEIKMVDTRNGKTTAYKLTEA